MRPGDKVTWSGTMLARGRFFDAEWYRLHMADVGHVVSVNLRGKVTVQWEGLPRVTEHRSGHVVPMVSCSTVGCGLPRYRASDPEHTPGHQERVGGRGWCACDDEELLFDVVLPEPKVRPGRRRQA